MAKYPYALKKPKARIPPAEAQRRIKLVDELGEIQSQIEPLKKRESELVKLFRALAEAECKPSKAVIYEGKRYLASITAKPDRRTIPFLSRLKILALLGKEKFCELCGFTVETAEKTLTEAQLAALLEKQENVGARSVTTVLRQKAA